MDPVAFIVLISFVSLVVFIVLFNSFFAEKKNRKMSENVDASRKHFYYLLETNENISVEKLSVKSINGAARVRSTIPTSLMPII